MTKNAIFEKFVIVILMTMFFFFYILQYYNTTFVCIALTVIELYTIIKYRKKPMLFFLFICMFYFDYSVIISKYLMNTPTLVSAYAQIRYEDTLYIGIASIFFFHAIILLFLKSENKCESASNNNLFSKDVKSETNYLVLIILTSLIAIVLFDYLFFDFLSLSRTIYEYLLVLFVLAFYYSKDNKVFRRILFVLMMISTAMNMIRGGRVVSLQPMIAYFFMNYLDTITSKKILIIIVCGVIIFTISGLYGDYMDYGYNLKDLDFTTIINTFLDRKMTLDTSISAYWTGLTFVEVSNSIPTIEKVKNFVEYITSYTVAGTSTNYLQLYDLSRQYYVHYNGGYITSYFYYWLNWVGVLGISIFIGNKIRQVNEANSNMSEFKKIYIVYFISSMPRWYLYYPTPLIRGTLILYIVYMFLKLITQKSKKKMEGIK